MWYKEKSMTLRSEGSKVGFLATKPVYVTLKKLLNFCKVQLLSLFGGCRNFLCQGYWVKKRLRKKNIHRRESSTVLGTHIAPFLLPSPVAGGNGSLLSAVFTALRGLGKTLKNMQPTETLSDESDDCELIRKHSKEIRMTTSRAGFARALHF